MAAMNILKELESTTGTQKNLMATQSIGERFGLLGDKSSTLVSMQRERPSMKMMNELEKSPMENPTQNSGLKIIKVKKNIQNNSYIDSRVIAQAQKQLRREKMLEKMKENQAKGQEPLTEGPNKQNVTNISQVITGDVKRYCLFAFGNFITVFSCQCIERRRR